MRLEGVRIAQRGRTQERGVQPDSVEGDTLALRGAARTVQAGRTRLNQIQH